MNAEMTEMCDVFVNDSYSLKANRNCCGCSAERVVEDGSEEGRRG